MTLGELSGLRGAVYSRLENAVGWPPMVVTGTLNTLYSYEDYGYSWAPGTIINVASFPCTSIDLRVTFGGRLTSPDVYQKISQALEGDVQFDRGFIQDLRVKIVTMRTAETWSPGVNLEATHETNLEIHCSCAGVVIKPPEVITQS